MEELREGRFKVNFNQGINIRLITPEAAQALAQVRYYDAKFVNRRLYTAWDNLGQEGSSSGDWRRLKTRASRPATSWSTCWWDTNRGRRWRRSCTGSAG